MRGRRSTRAGAGAGAGGGAHGFVARGGALPRLELPIQRSHDDFRRRAIQLACAPHVHSDQAKSCGSRAGSTPAHGGLEAGGERRRGRTEGELDLAVQDVIGEIGQRRVPLEDLNPHPLQRTRAGLRRRAARAARWGRAWARARGGGGKGARLVRGLVRQRVGILVVAQVEAAGEGRVGAVAHDLRAPVLLPASIRAVVQPEHREHRHARARHLEQRQARAGCAARQPSAQLRRSLPLARGRVGGAAHQRRSRRARSPCRPTEPPPRPHRAAG